MFVDCDDRQFFIEVPPSENYLKYVRSAAQVAHVQYGQFYGQR
jgi:hypothetical protein